MSETLHQKILLPGRTWLLLLLILFSKKYSGQSALDPSFCNSGIKLFTIHPTYNGASEILLRSNVGEYLLGWYPDPTNSFDVTTILALKNNGSIDSSWATNGAITTTLTSASSFAQQTDGKLILFGNANVWGSAFFRTIRFMPDGSVDNSFGISGVVNTTVTSGDNIAGKVRLQSDGKIIVAGSNPFPNSCIILARYNSDGTLDNTFGTNGTATIAIGTADPASPSCVDLLIQPDDKILVATNYKNGAGSASSIIRYNANGSLDNTFAINGVYTQTLVSESLLALQQDGKIISGGSASGPDCQIFRLNGNGSVDNTYGNNGIAITTPSLRPMASVVQPDNKLMVAGWYAVPGGGTLEATRYNADGSKDGSFATNSMDVKDVSSGADTPKAICFKPDGKILVAGVSADIVNSITYFMLAQYVSGLQIGIREWTKNINNFSVFPNPFSFSFNLNFHSVSSEAYLYSITDILGIEIKRDNFKTNFGSNTIDINFKGGYGVYILKVFDGQKLLYTQKLIKND
jgi:uncharacterized delta-60 repeat protein